MQSEFHLVFLRPNSRLAFLILSNSSPSRLTILQIDLKLYSSNFPPFRFSFTSAIILTRGPPLRCHFIMTEKWWGQILITSLTSTVSFRWTFKLDFRMTLDTKTAARKRINILTMNLFFTRNNCIIFQTSRDELNQSDDIWGLPIWSSLSVNSWVIFFT